jgi:hypothetical protein
MDEDGGGRPKAETSPETPPPDRGNVSSAGTSVPSPGRSSPDPRRLEDLEGKVVRLARAVAGLEARLTALESGPPAAASGPEEDLVAEEVLEPLVPDARAVAGVLTEIGRCILVAAGGFLVRAITDSGAIPRAAGVAAGLGYALAWILLADRTAAHGRRRAASFLSITAIALSYPLLFETTARMNVFSAVGASVAITLLTALVLAVASRRDLLVVGWLAVLAEAITAVLLGFTTGRPEPFAAACAVIAAATAFLGDAWEGAGALRWPAALVADLLVLWTALRLPGLSPASLPPALLVFALAAFLALGPLGWATGRVLARRRPVGFFEAIQVTVSLAIGFGAAIQAAAVFPHSMVWVATALFAAAAACLVIAIAARPVLSTSNAFLYISWGVGLFFGGGFLLPGAIPSAFLWSVLGVAAAGVSRLPAWRPLRIYATLLLLAAAAQSGLLSASLRALSSAADAAWPPVTATAGIAFAAVVASYLLINRRVESRDLTGSAASLVLAAVACVSLAAAGVIGLRELWPGDAATLAAVRTAVLSVAALSLAWARRRSNRPELSWLAAAFLATGAVKLLFEDLPNGRSLTLFAGFVLYGLSLLGVQRLLRSRSAPAV